MKFVLLLNFLLFFSVQALAIGRCADALKAGNIFQELTQHRDDLVFLRSSRSLDKELFGKEVSKINEKLLIYVDRVVNETMVFINENKTGLTKIAKDFDKNKALGNNGAKSTKERQFLIKNFLDRYPSYYEKLLATQIFFIDYQLDIYLEKQDSHVQLRQLSKELDKKLVPAMNDLLEYSKKLKKEVKIMEREETELGDIPHLYKNP